MFQKTFHDTRERMATWAAFVAVEKREGRSPSAHHPCSSEGHRGVAGSPAVHTPDTEQVFTELFMG